MSDQLPRFLDGPKFVAFLKSEGVQRHHLTESQKRRYYEWERGARADLYSPTGDTSSVDQILTEHSLFNLIPDDCWSEDQEPTKRGPNKSTLAAAAA
jgi:hypothetical protein